MALAAGNVAQTDFQLSWAEHQAATAVLRRPKQMQHVIHRISSLLDLVHFQWYERRQLARGAACLKQVRLLWHCMRESAAAQNSWAIHNT